MCVLKRLWRKQKNWSCVDIWTCNGTLNLHKLMFEAFWFFFPPVSVVRIYSNLPVSCFKSCWMCFIVAVLLVFYYKQTPLLFHSHLHKPVDAFVCVVVDEIFVCVCTVLKLCRSRQKADGSRYEAILLTLVADSGLLRWSPETKEAGHERGNFSYWLPVFYI